MSPGGVLWAEDNLEDQILIRSAVAELPRPPAVRFANDGAYLLDMLDPATHFVVLDLKMPRIGGLEALRRMRGDPRWRDLAAAVFSAGDHAQETAECYALGVVDVVQKPVPFDQFVASVQRVLSHVPPAAGQEATPAAP